MKTSNILRRTKRAASRGVTLIEILIVLAIIGLISGGVALVAVPKLKQAQVSQAKNDAIQLHDIAERYRADHPAAGSCVTVEQLRAEKEISSTSKIQDPWGKNYVIQCADDETYIVSVGPDGKEGTADDVKVPSITPTAQ